MSITVRHLSKTFGAFAALHDVSLEVPGGELVALLGPSGSGKTTLLRLIAGLETPDPNPDSSIYFYEENVAGRQVGERQVGFVFQHYALFRHMTVFDNISFGLRVRPRATRPPAAEIRDRVRELLKLIQLEGLESRYPSQLSGGQRQRVALARALAVQPKVLLLDEPFGALDAKVRQGLRRWLRRLHDELHVTSVFVTHDQEEALEVADRIVVMNKGRIEQVGTPTEVFHHPANEFVMDFLGNVNLFHGRIESGKAVFGGLALSPTGQSAADGQAARLFVRPHDLEVHLTPPAGDSFPATVERIQAAGAVVKLELRGAQAEVIAVELSHERFQALKLAKGAAVHVSLRDAHVFVQGAEDYAI